MSSSSLPSPDSSIPLPGSLFRLSLHVFLNEEYSDSSLIFLLMLLSYVSTKEDRFFRSFWLSLSKLYLEKRLWELKLRGELVRLGDDWWYGEFVFVVVDIVEFGCCCWKPAAKFCKPSRLCWNIPYWMDLSMLVLECFEFRKNVWKAWPYLVV